MELTGRRRTGMMGVMLGGGFLAALGQSLLASALPTLIKVFGVDATTAQWLTTSYILVLGIVSALSAFLINRVPTRTLFLGSMTLFTAGCILSLFAWNFPVLLISRIIQGIGAGILMPQTQVVALQMYPRDQQGRAFGTVGLALAFAPAIGPTLSGILVDWLGWRSIFYLMLIIAVIVLVVGLRLMQNVGEQFPAHLDIPSVLLYSVGFCALMLSNSVHSASIWPTLLLIVAGVLLLAAFVLRQLKLESPFLDVRVFSNRNFTLTFVLAAIDFLAQFAGTMLVPLYLQSARGITATVSGLVMLPGAIATIVANLVGGKLLDSKGPHFVAVLGTALLTVGTVAFCAFNEQTSLAVIAVVYVVQLFGVAVSMMPLTGYGVGCLSGEQLSHGNAINTSMRQMFGTLGASTMVVIASAASAGGKTDVHGINVAFAAQTILYAVGLLLSIFLMKGRPAHKAVGTAETSATTEEAEI